MSDDCACGVLSNSMQLKGALRKGSSCCVPFMDTPLVITLPRLHLMSAARCGCVDGAQSGGVPCKVTPDAGGVTRGTIGTSRVGLIYNIFAQSRESECACSLLSVINIASRPDTIWDTIHYTVFDHRQYGFIPVDLVGS